MKVYVGQSPENVLDRNNMGLAEVQATAGEQTAGAFQV